MAVARTVCSFASLLLAGLAGSAFAAAGTLYRWGDAMPAAALSAAPAAASSASSALRAAQCALHKEQLESYQAVESIQDMEAHDQMRSYSEGERSELIEAAQKAIAASCQS